MNTLPTRAELTHAFHYDLVRGVLVWRNNRRADLIGTDAGTPHNGRVTIKFKQRSYRAHRLIWMYVYGEDPGELELDHINRIPTDNRIENLRKVTHQENHQNRSETVRNGGMWKDRDNDIARRYDREYKRKQREQSRL